MSRRGRGNPNWIQAAEARRQADASAVTEEAKEMTEPEAPNEVVSSLAEFCAPLFGNVLGTAIVETVPPVADVRREYVSAGTVAAGVAIALNTRGAVRNGAIAMAATALAHELLRLLGFGPVAQPPTITEPAREPVHDAGLVTRKDLEEALTKLHDAQREAVVASVRDAASEIAVASGPPEEAPPNESTWTAPPASQEQEEHADAMRAVFDRLGDNERRQLSALIASLPHRDAASFTQELAALPVEHAVARARATIPRLYDGDRDRS